MLQSDIKEMTSVIFFISAETFAVRTQKVPFPIDDGLMITNYTRKAQVRIEFKQRKILTHWFQQLVPYVLEVVAAAVAEVVAAAEAEELLALVPAPGPAPLLVPELEKVLAQERSLAETLRWSQAWKVRKG